ncbi:MAG: hypothetical protein IJK28_12215 [Clostridia bacterium]|nr:hypothetical protein [Clostridia bacterium]
MKYHIDTIPVWDAVKQDCECFLCALETRTEQQEAERFLGASVMEPDIRIQVNRQGFCRNHHRMLFGMGNRLGHALMLESHTAESIRTVSACLNDIKKAAGAASGSILSKYGRSGQAVKKSYEEAVGRLADAAGGCILCEAVHTYMQRCCETVLLLWENDSEFRRQFSGTKGLCLCHLADLLRLAPQVLSSRLVPEFADAVEKLEKPNLDRIQEDISWFIKKFDYRYEAEPWKNSQNAVQRTCNKLRGACLPEDQASSGR